MKAVCRAQAQERMLAKLVSPRFLLDPQPLLPATQAEQLTDEFITASFRSVFTMLMDALPGEVWSKTPKMKNIHTSARQPVTRPICRLRLRGVSGAETW